MVEVQFELQHKHSLHPRILTNVTIVQRPVQENCHLHVVYILPASVFVDPYQLQDLEASLGKATIFGEHDLELPLEKVKEPRGSAVFLRQNCSTLNFQLELPFHLRYQQPSLEKNSQSIVIQAPYAGWTCGDYKYPPLSNIYPIITPALQDESAFEKFSFDSTPLTLSVPIGKVQDASLVTYGTFGTVLFCTVWIVRSVFVSISKRRRTEAKGKRRKSE
ncbi:unnamed protein product [Mucor hiemalis]